MSLKELLGDNVVGKDGKPVDVASLSDNTLIGIYFSAHWCPPCRGFTPVLAKFYTEAKDSGKKIEIIFVSSDRDEESFNEYYGEMPWLTLAFSDREKKAQLAEKYSIRGIPTLILVKPNGDLATNDGRNHVTSEPGNFPWGY